MSKKFDDLDFKILELLLDDSSSTLISLANSLNVDKRSISRRISRLKEEGVIRKFTIDIDWTKLGMTMDAYVGTRTSVGEELRSKMFEFFNKHPRIVSVASTIGAHEYVFRVICRDTHDFRTRIGTPLEPLTAGLSSSVVSEYVKPPDYKPLLRLIAESRVT